MSAAARETRTGELLSQSYELHEVLESESSYDVYRATDRKHARTVRVRVLRAQFALQSNAVQSFVRDPTALTGLCHPNASRVLAVESDETGIPFVVEEHVEGEPLARTIERFPEGVPLGLAINVLAPVVEAVAVAHELGIVHGRIDRDHVLVQQLGGSSVPKLVRFGAEPAGVAAGARALDHTAPELRDGRCAPDPRSDVWALGALLYETLSGCAAGSGKRRAPLDEVAPHLPGELVELVERCLSNAPSARPERAAALSDVLSGMRSRMRPAAPAKPQPAPQPAAEVEEQRTRPASPIAPAPRKRVGRRTATGREVALPELEEASFAGIASSIPPQQPCAAAPVDAALLATVPGAGDDAAHAEFAHGATMVALNAPDSPPMRADAQAHPELDDAPEIELFARAQDSAEDALPDQPHHVQDEQDEPEITLEAVISSARPAAPPTAAVPGATAPRSQQKVEMKTMSDLAAAFGPIEGAERIGQADASSNPKKQAVETGKGGRSARDADGRRKPDQDKRNARRSSDAVPVRALSDEQIRLLRERTQTTQRGRERMLGALVFFLFAAGLMFAIPLLCDPTHTKAQALLGTKLQLVAGGFAVLSLVALIRTWALQIQARPALLRPVTFTLKLVTAAVCVLVASFFLPTGALGPAETAARSALPWAASLFYLFLALHGIMHGIRETAANGLLGIALVLLYSGGFFGSYRVLSTSVLAASSAGHGAAELEGQSVGAKVDSLGAMKKLAQGEHGAAGKGAVDRVADRGEVGASEAEDMRAIEEMTNARKKKSQQFERMNEQMDELIR